MALLEGDRGELECGDEKKEIAGALAQFLVLLDGVTGTGNSLGGTVGLGARLDGGHAEGRGDKKEGRRGGIGPGRLAGEGDEAKNHAGNAECDDEVDELGMELGDVGHV